MKTVSWTTFVTSLKSCLNDSSKREVWYAHYAQLLSLGSDNPKSKQKILSGAEFSKVILSNLSRARSQIQQANQWVDPLIGNPENPTDLSRTRGYLWRYVLAYSGWENCTKKLLMSHNLQEHFFYESSALRPPRLSNQQKASLARWLGINAEELEADDVQLYSGNISLFLSITAQDYKSFPDWLIGRQTQLSQPQILAIMRNMVAHGSLLPTKSEQWGLTPLYAKGPRVINRAFQSLLTKLYPYDTCPSPD